jgi:hypothetical protein
MNKFAAEHFISLTNLLERMDEMASRGWEHLDGLLRMIEQSLESIGCVHSVDAVKPIRLMLASPPVDRDAIKHRCVCLTETIMDEMKRHLFFWVPSERAIFYNKRARDVFGEECLSRFIKTDIGREVERGLRCYAFGEWTACGFHMVRIGDAGVRAFASAIKYTGIFSWGSVYTALIQQRENKASRGPHWSGNESFLEETALHLRDIKPYRDELAHFKSTYDDKDAKRMMDSIPAFMQQVSSKLDEDGKWIV